MHRQKVQSVFKPTLITENAKSGVSNPIQSLFLDARVKWQFQLFNLRVSFSPFHFSRSAIMTDQDSQVNKLLITAAIAAIAAGAAYYVYTRQEQEDQVAPADASTSTGCCASSSCGSTTTALPPKISKENAGKLFEQVNVKMTEVVMKLSALERQYREEAAASGSAVDEEQLMMTLHAHFENSLRQVSMDSYGEFSTTEEDVQMAVEYYAQDEFLQGQVARLNSLIQAVSGHPTGPITEPDGSVPADIAFDTLISILVDTFDAMGETMERTCRELASQALPQAEIHEKLQARYTAEADAATVKVFTKYGVSREAFQNATLKHHQDPTFLAKVQELQISQQARFSAATELLQQ